MPRFIEKVEPELIGLRDAGALPWVLPYNLQPVDVFRMVEDLYVMLHEVNARLHALGYHRLEELLDPAGFSGFVSRSAVERLDRLSRALVQNGYHNGYPDLLPQGAYPADRVQHGDRGGLEVKASRYESGWQSHGPRAGWFCVVQFDLDRDETKALLDREPTAIRAVMVAELTEDDWSWAPAQEGHIRSGTASVKPSGAAKLRSGAVWVAPEYADQHEAKRVTACVGALRPNVEHLIAQTLEDAGQPLPSKEVVERLAAEHGVPASAVKSCTETSLRKMARSGMLVRPARGVYGLP